MKSSLREIALLTVALLFGACSGREPARPAARDEATKPTPSSVHAAPAAPAHPAAAEALTATVQPTPASIADDPATTTVTKTFPAAVDPPAREQVDQTPKEVFDRPLDPSEVQVDRFVLAQAVQQREPLGETDVFSTEAEKIFAFVQLANPQQPPYSFKVHFEKADEAPTPYGIALEVPTAARFRTWAFTRIKREPGQYRAVLRTLDGREIARRDFTVVPADGALHDGEPEHAGPHDHD